MSWNSQSILSHLSATVFLIAQVAGGLFGEGGEGGGGGVGSRLRCSFAHSTNKNASFANYFLLLILETPEERHHTKGTTKHGQFLLTFLTDSSSYNTFPLMAIKIQRMSLTQKHEKNALMIIAVKEVAYAVAKRKPEKISGLLWFEPWPVRYRCSAPKKWNYQCCICRQRMHGVFKRDRKTY